MRGGAKRLAEVGKRVDIHVHSTELGLQRGAIVVMPLVVDTRRVPLGHLAARETGGAEVIAREGAGVRGAVADSQLGELCRLQPQPCDPILHALSLSRELRGGHNDEDARMWVLSEGG